MCSSLCSYAILLMECYGGCICSAGDGLLGIVLWQHGCNCKCCSSCNHTRPMQPHTQSGGQGFNDHSWELCVQVAVSVVTYDGMVHHVQVCTEDAIAYSLLWLQSMCFVIARWGRKSLACLQLLAFSLGRQQ